MPRLTKKDAEEAMQAYLADEPDWRSKWQSFFMGLSMESTYAEGRKQGQLVLELGDDFSAMMQEVSEMFLDHQGAAHHPRIKPIQRSGRPVANTHEQRRAMWMHTLIGIQLDNDKGRQSRELSFRQVAKRISRLGGTCDWRQCRSLWNNRKRSYHWRTTEWLIEQMGSTGWDDDFLDKLASLFVNAEIN